MLCYEVVVVVSSFAIILPRKRELIAFLLSCVLLLVCYVFSTWFCGFKAVVLLLLIRC